MSMRSKKKTRDIFIAVTAIFMLVLLTVLLSKKLFNHVDNNISEQTPTEDVVEKVDGLSLNYQELIF